MFHLNDSDLRERMHYTFFIYWADINIILFLNTSVI
jgi:hypothetical protein